MIERLVETAYRQHPWLGASSLEEAIAATIQYRRNLDAADQELFDAQIRQGRYPAAVIETIEIVTGRNEPQGNQVVGKEVVEANRT